MRSFTPSETRENAVEFSIKTLAPERAKTGCLVLGVHPGGALTRAARLADRAARGALRSALALGDLTGKPGSTLLLRELPGLAAQRVLLVGLGERKELGEQPFRDAVRGAANALRELGAKDATLYLGELKAARRSQAWGLRQLVLGLREAFYRFDQLKTQKKPPVPALTAVTLAQSEGPVTLQAQAALKEALATADGAALARTLGNLPPNICTPTYLAQEAKKLAQQYKLKRAGARAARHGEARHGRAALGRQGLAPAAQAHRAANTTARPRPASPWCWSARASPSTPAASRSSRRPRWTR